MKIKIKVKNIILILLASIFIYLIIIPYATLQIARYYDGKYSDKARIFYESYLSKAIILDKNDALYNYAIGLASSPDKYQIMMGSWGGGTSNNTLDDMNKGIDALKQILEKGNKSKKDKKYTALAYSKIMDIYISLQSPEELLQWIQWGGDSEDGNIKYISDIYNAFYHYANRDYDMADKVLDKYNKDSEFVDYRYYYMKGEIALFKGNRDLAKQYYEDIRYINFRGYGDTLFASRSFDLRNYWLEDYYDKIKGHIKVSGKVTFNGKPMPFVEIYLKTIGAGMTTGGGDMVSITDINGEYETLGFDQNRYEIGIGLSQAMLYDKVFLSQGKRFIDLDKDIEYDFAFVSPFNVINPSPEQIANNNKFTVEWEAVKDAEFYKVHVTSFINIKDKSGGHHSFPIEDENDSVKLYGTKAIFDISELKRRPGGLSWGGEQRIVSPTAILGGFFPGQEYPIVVNAYDKDSNLLGSSAPIRTFYEDFPSIKIEGKLSQGENLIYNMKYEEAIDFYNNVLKEDQNNEEALIYLTKIYMVSYKKDKQDYDKAVDYATRYDSLNNNKSMVYEVIGFMDRNAIRKYKDLIKATFDSIPEDERDEDFYFNESRYYLSIRDYKSAMESFEQIESYMHPYLMYIDMYFGDIDKALERINSGNLDLYNMDKNALIKALEGLNQSDIDSKDYEVLKGIIEKVLSENINYSQGRELYANAITKITNPNIKSILNEIRSDNHWDKDYVD